MNIPKTFAEHKKYMDAQDIKMDNLSSQIEELKTKIQQIEAALEPMRKQLNEFNIAELFKGGDGLNEGSQAALNMIGAIEKQLKDKIRFLEDRLLKVEQDSIKIKNETTGIKNAQDNINRHLTQNEEALKAVNTNIDEIFNRTGEMEGKVSNFTKALEEHKIEAKGNFDKIYEEIEKLKNSFNDQIKSYLEEHPINASNPEEFKQLLDKEINGVKKSITELERILRNYAKDFGLYELREDVNKLLKDIKNKVNLEDFKELEEAVFDIKDKLIAAMKDDINILKEDNQAGKDDLQEFKRIFANLKATVNELKIAESVGNPMGDVGGRIQQIDTSKFVDQNQFHVFQLQVSNEFKDANSNFENLKNFIDDILDNLKTKTTFKDLKTLEDDITTRLEELKTACIKRFADKQDSSKNFKYLDQQIKHIIEVYIKKQDKSDNWLIAKKPFGHCCASCENYIGDLKENNNYVPWNKYPMRDPNDKLYRIGTGFSKMLQMISLDGNNTQTMNNMPLSPVSNTQPSMPIEENSKTMIGFHPKNELKKVLPTIEGKRMTTTVNQKIEEFNEDTQEIEAVEEFNQPKM